MSEEKTIVSKRLIDERKKRCSECDCYNEEDDWCEAYGNLCYEIINCKPFKIED